MGRLFGVREQCFWTVWDTALYEGGRCDLPPMEIELFGAYNIGRTHRTNMKYVHTLGPNQTMAVMAMPTLVSFEDERLYDVFSRGARLKLMVEDKVVHETPGALSAVVGLPPQEEDVLTIVKKMRELAVTNEELHRAIAAMPGLAFPKPVMIYERARFSATMSFTPYGEDALKRICDSAGVKSIVQCLRGILTRDVY